MATLENLYPLLAQQALRGVPAVSFLQERFSEVSAWREEARELLESLLLYAPAATELAPELVDHTETADFTLQKWYITPSPTERVPVMLLLPRGFEGPRPAIVALHCHGGMYYFGKRKLIADESDPAILAQYREELYGGIGIANALAARGYVVAVIDAFYFGERRLTVPQPADMQSDFLLAPEGSDQWITLLNQVSGRMETVVAKSMTYAGMTWPGVLAWDDRRTVDFLLTRPEVDPARIGCVGLSMGGMRAALLGALDPRVKAVCIVGWMSTLAEMIENHITNHAWPDFLPGLVRVLDWPDVAALHAPNPLLVMQGSQDSLFSLEGYQKAAERLRAVYAKAGVPGSLDIGLYDLPHTFSPEMQDYAWDFFARALEG